jgi:hypothetical protein
MNEVTTAPEKGLQTTNGGINIATTVEAADIQIPKIHLMQGLSDFVAEQRASMGDFVDSLTAEKLGDSKNPVKIIPICMWKDYLITELQGKKFEFKEIKPYNVDTQHWREFEHREYEENGVPHQRNLRMNFAVLLERDKDELGAFPHVISFQRTGIKAGKSIANFLLKSQTKGKKPWMFTLGLGCKLDKNDQGTFYVPQVASAIETPDYERVSEICSMWEGIFARGAARIDESDATVEAGGKAPATGSPETRF